MATTSGPSSSPRNPADASSITTADTNVSGHFAQSAPTPVPSAPSTPLPTTSDPFASAVAGSNTASPAADGGRTSVPASAVDSVSIGTALRRALAPNRRDGPGLVTAIERYNAAMLALQESGEMEAWMREHARDVGDAHWSALCERINEMAYARVVGPYSYELEVSGKEGKRVAPQPCTISPDTFYKAQLTNSITPSTRRRWRR